MLRLFDSVLKLIVQYEGVGKAQLPSEEPSTSTRRDSGLEYRPYQRASERTLGEVLTDLQISDLNMGPWEDFES